MGKVAVLLVIVTLISIHGTLAALPCHSYLRIISPQLFTHCGKCFYSSWSSWKAVKTVESINCASKMALSCPLWLQSS